MIAGGGVHFRVWAPQSIGVEVVTEDGRAYTLASEVDGYFAGAIDAAAGTLYHFRLGESPALLPDPASRFQPRGPHGPSQIVDASAFRWTDRQWPGIRIEGQVIYELHVGTFTPEGTWNAARLHLPKLAEMGITLIEMMPVAEFPGQFGWGYDGVDLFAPSHLYGTPDDLRSFIDAAHAYGLGVILDVVYNHLGPDGNYLKKFSESYFTARYPNEWGEAINFDGPNSTAVREFFCANAAYWIGEFHFDGLRLDATQQVFDSSKVNILVDVARDARAAAGKRSIVVIGENEHQRSRLIREYGLDALWNDDFHHTARVALTGRAEAYYSDFQGSSQEFISAVKWGFLYQGQYFGWQNKCRGAPAFDMQPSSFVAYIQNHDQVANSASGKRIHRLTSPARFRAITALLLLGPETPMLFQGQEFCASAPFLYFADHNPELAQLVLRGRSEFLHQFKSIGMGNSTPIDPPHDRATFEKCKLDHAESETHSSAVALHRDLLRLRRDDPVFRAQRSDWLHGAVIGASAFVLRFFGGRLGDRLLVVNLGHDLNLCPAPEPLLAPPEGDHWKVLWSSEDPAYGGCSYSPVDARERWSVCGESAVVLGAGSST
jgi:maltooligosyltrehalose trehalohydrolase